MPHFSRQANGDIYPCRFVKTDTTASGCVIQATAGDKTFGISQKDTRYAPFSAIDDGKAAIAGEMVGVSGPPDTEILLEVGAVAVAADVWLKSDGDGKGVLASTDHDQVGARALRPGNPGDFIPVQILQFTLSV